MQDIINKSESELKSKKIYFESMNFRREAIHPDKLKYKVNRDIMSLGDEEYKVVLSIEIKALNESFELQVSIVGIFEIKSESISEELKNSVISRNTIAILFPYLRTQITLLTAQPDLNPIVLPAININTLLDNMESMENE